VSSPTKELVVIVGPTASGKTDFAIRLAQRHVTEIVSADSVQIYRRFDLGTGKPSPEQRAQVPHWLIDVAEPLEPMDAARWAELAAAQIQVIHARGRRAIVCGGSFLWILALLFGLAPAPPADTEVRARHRGVVESRGRQALHAELLAVDPSSAQRLSPNDTMRVSRALEVFELTGTPMSRWQAEHGFRQPRYRYRLIGIALERSELDARIYTRVKSMLDAGWIQEVQGLLSQGFRRARAMGSVGYRQIAEALESSTPIDVGKLSDAIYRATRRFARRQRTWLRDQPVEWVPRESAETLVL
jgi:tRNA dimethylallyltransferase